MNFLFLFVVILSFICIMLELWFFILCFMMKHFSFIIYFIFWLCSLTINIGIIIFDKFKRVRIYYIICIVIFLNSMFAACVTVFNGFSRTISDGAMLNYVSQNFPFVLKINILTGNWLLPIIYSLRRLVKKMEADIYSP